MLTKSLFSRIYLDILCYIHMYIHEFICQTIVLPLNLFTQDGGSHLHSLDGILKGAQQVLHYSLYSNDVLCTGNSIQPIIVSVGLCLLANVQNDFSS